MIWWQYKKLYDFTKYNEADYNFKGLRVSYLKPL